MDPNKVWSVGTAIAGTALVAELLPVVLGTGAEAVIDWGFIYVALRYAFLPTASFVLLLSIVVGLFGTAGPTDRLTIAAASIIPLGYLMLVWFHPLLLFV